MGHRLHYHWVWHHRTTCPVRCLNGNTAVLLEQVSRKLHIINHLNSYYIRTLTASHFTPKRNVPLVMMINRALFCHWRSKQTWKKTLTDLHMKRRRFHKMAAAMKGLIWRTAALACKSPAAARLAAVPDQMFWERRDSKWHASQGKVIQ